MSDLISRQKSLDGLKYEMKYGAEIDRCGLDTAYDIIENIPSAEPDNQVHLCDFCKYGYPECLAEISDVIFGNGIGHDNVCACAKFEIKPEQKKGKWIKVGHWGRSYKCNQCGNYLDFDGVNTGRGDVNFCPNCGARMTR